MLAEPIVYLMDSYRNPFAGTEGQVYQIVKHIQHSGYNPTLIVFRPSEYLADNDFICPIEVLGISSIFSVRAIYKLVAMAFRLKRRGVRIVHIFFNDASVVAPIILKIFGIKVLISRRDMGFWYTPFIEMILSFNRFFIKAAVVNSEAVKQVTHKKEKIALENIHVIYNGYEQRLKSSYVPSLSGLFGCEPGVVIGLLANIREIKRMEDAIFAVRKMKDKDACLVIMGDGDVSGLKDLAKELGVAARVGFSGPLKNPLPWLSIIDIGVLCSESEGFSNAIVEYMYCGKPVVCSEVGGNPEAITHGLNGFLYQLADTDKLADYLDKLVADKELRLAMGREGQHKVAAEYGVESMIQAYSSLYSKLIL